MVDIQFTQLLLVDADLVFLLDLHDAGLPLLPGDVGQLSLQGGGAGPRVNQLSERAQELLLQSKHDYRRVRRGQGGVVGTRRGDVCLR